MPKPKLEEYTFRLGDFLPSSDIKLSKFVVRLAIMENDMAFLGHMLKSLVDEKVTVIDKPAIVHVAPYIGRLIIGHGKEAIDLFLNERLSEIGKIAAPTAYEKVRQRVIEYEAKNKHFLSRVRTVAFHSVLSERNDHGSKMLVRVLDELKDDEASIMLGAKLPVRYTFADEIASFVEDYIVGMSTDEYVEKMFEVLDLVGEGCDEILGEFFWSRASEERPLKSSSET